MKNFKNLGFLFGLMAAFFMVSCEDDPGGGGGGGGGNEDFPTVSVTGPGTDITADFGDVITFTVTAAEGKDPLNSITVTENGSNLPLERVLIDGTSIANPILLTGTDKTSFVKEVAIIAASEVATNSYQIIVSDEGSRNVTTDFNVTTNGLPPTLDFTSMMSGSVEIDANSLQGYPLDGVKGSSTLSTLTVYEDGALMDPTRIFWDGPAVSDNPFALDAQYADGFSDVDLQLRSSTEIKTSNYRVVLTDATGLEDDLEFTITTKVPGTPVDVEFGLLFNQAGPSGTGGFDLDDIVGTGSMSTLAEIRDLGNDTNGDWLKQIATINGSQIKYVRAGQNGVAESFTFDGVAVKEEIPGLFDNGLAYSSETVVVGDVFGVERDGNYYLIRIAEINETTGDNDDNYKIDVAK